MPPANDKKTAVSKAAILFRQADELLQRSLTTQDMNERSWLLSVAAALHMQAVKDEGATPAQIEEWRRMWCEQAADEDEA